MKIKELFSNLFTSKATRELREKEKLIIARVEKNKLRNRLYYQANKDKIKQRRAELKAIKESKIANNIVEN